MRNLILSMAAVCAVSTLASAQDASLAATARAGAAPNYFLGRWTVCINVSDHVPDGNPTVQVVKVPNDSGHYTFKPDASGWEPGWRALVLSVVGTQPANMPADSVPPPCNSEVQGTQPMVVDSNTIRLRGGTCLPEGNANHVKGTCDNDVPRQGLFHYHEIVIFAKPTGIKHMVLQMCSRDELGDNAECPEHADAGPNQRPHPGHIHLQN